MPHRDNRTDIISANPLTFRPSDSFAKKEQIIQIYRHKGTERTLYLPVFKLHTVKTPPSCGRKSHALRSIFYFHAHEIMNIYGISLHIFRIYEYIFTKNFFSAYRPASFPDVNKNEN